jgi:hypothetical protein
MELPDSVCLQMADSRDASVTAAELRIAGRK